MGAGSLSTRQEHTHGRRVAVLVTSGRGARASCPRHMCAHAAPETTSAGHEDWSCLQAQSLMAQQDAMIFTFLPLEFQHLGQVPRSDPLASSLKVQSALGAAEYEATNVTVIWLWSRACSPQGRGLRASTDPNAGQGGVVQAVTAGHRGPRGSRHWRGFLRGPEGAFVAKTTPLVPTPRPLRDPRADVSPRGQPPPRPPLGHAICLTATSSEARLCHPARGPGAASCSPAAFGESRGSAGFSTPPW